MSQKQSVNPQWLNRTFKEASQKGTYFTGRNPREIATSIVKHNEMHHKFVGKLDDMITKLMKKGRYEIIGGQLVRSDNVISIVATQRLASANRKASRQRRIETAERRKRQATAWHAEQIAAY